MTTPKEALERARTAINAIVLSTHSVSFKADLDAIDSALASLQGEDAVERVARIIDTEAFEDDRLTWHDRRISARTKARAILATGLVPDEAAIRADEREKCAKVADSKQRSVRQFSVAADIAAAIRSNQAKP